MRNVIKRMINLKVESRTIKDLLIQLTYKITKKLEVNLYNMTRQIDIYHLHISSDVR